MAIGKQLSAVVVLALTFPALAQAEPDLEFGQTETEKDAVVNDTSYGWFSHGYLRFGVGATDGDTFVPFQLDGAPAKYRLGNESDIYGELGLGYRAKLGNGSDFVVEGMLNGFGDSNAFTTGAPFNGGSNVVQAYAGIENIGSGALREAFIWGGRRYYLRRDVHINDFYYENMSGDGIGIENMRFGSVGVSVAAFHYEDDASDFLSNALDARVQDIGFGGDWVGEVGAIWIDGSGTDLAASDGYSIRFHFENTKLDWGEFRNALMFGSGLGIDFNSTGASYATSDDRRLRFVSQALIKSSEDLESQATLVVQQSRIAGEDQSWISMGIRPQYNITDDWGIAVEAGFDWFRDGNSDQSLGKITIAPFYSFGKKGFFARPQLRAFVTWANWSEVGAITEQAALGNVTDGLSAGIQLETWW